MGRMAQRMAPHTSSGQPRRDPSQLKVVPESMRARPAYACRRVGVGPCKEDHSLFLAFFTLWSLFFLLTLFHHQNQGGLLSGEEYASSQSLASTASITSFTIALHTTQHHAREVLTCLIHCFLKVWSVVHRGLRLLFIHYCK